MHPSLLEKRDQIAAVCQANGVARLDVFGSAARGNDFDPARSDVDFLIAFTARAGVDRYIDLKDSLERILGRPVDLIDRRSVETSRNYIRKRHILSGAEKLYVSG